MIFDIPPNYDIDANYVVTFHLLPYSPSAQPHMLTMRVLNDSYIRMKKDIAFGLLNVLTILSA